MDIEAEAKVAETAQRIHTLLMNSRVPLRCAERVGSASMMADVDWAAARDKLVDGLGSGFTSVILGPTGAGKTQLATDIMYANCLMPRTGVYCRGFDLLDLLEPHTGNSAVSRVEDEGLLVVDDLTRTSGGDRANLEYLIDLRYSAKLDTLLIVKSSARNTGQPADSWSELASIFGEYIASRVLEVGQIIRLNTILRVVGDGVGL